MNTYELLKSLVGCTITEKENGVIEIAPNANKEAKNPQPQFKDGDFVCLDNLIFIYKSTELGYVRAYASLCQESLSVDIEILCEDRLSESFKCATDKEVQLLIDALQKERKIWNPDTNEIEEDRAPRVGDKCVFWDEGDKDVTISNLYDIHSLGSRYCTEESGTLEYCVRFQDFDFETMQPKY